MGLPQRWSQFYLAEIKIEAQIAPNIRTWRHTGFNVDE